MSRPSSVKLGSALKAEFASIRKHLRNTTRIRCKVCAPQYGRPRS